MGKSGVPRSEIFLTTKVNPDQGENGTVAAHEENLRLLGLDYVDLLLVHFPCNFDGVTDCSMSARQASWRGLERLHKAGKARAIGVSHYCQKHLQDVLDIATVPVAINQQEWHVGMEPDPEGVRSFCDAHNITFQPFSPLCGPCGTHELITGNLVTGIGAAHNKSGSQVSLRWLVENGSPVIAKTDNPKHLALNMDLFFVETHSCRILCAECSNIAAQCRNCCIRLQTDWFLGRVRVFLNWDLDVVRCRTSMSNQW